MASLGYAVFIGWVVFFAGIYWLIQKHQPAVS